ncbi:MAG: Lipid A export ATP-binding/permease protein MsbA [Stenotrophomonas maltophilia]|uniref:Lipid A export ATP-binding/permease protein MsbA n=1 Tax=Stenotrophomonas maltophilia TaxID=40324 RepID=A0A7V8JLW7_STEMA|nr:MAG: Lipid A export ATP-binding/permease protein MsbA [Stenotrophomonas maltophilia]
MTLAVTLPRFAPLATALLLALASAPLAAQEFAPSATTNPSGCAAIDTDAARLACYDRIYGRTQQDTAQADAAAAAAAQAIREQRQASRLSQGEEKLRSKVGDLFRPAPDDSALANAGRGSLLDSRWELAEDSKLGPFQLRAYKPVYLLPAFWSSDKNTTPHSPNPANTVSTPQVLDSAELKFQISFKTKIAENLFGDNGAGKTTLVKLLARLYDPDEGRIPLDGHDLRDYDLDDLRANLGVIFQDFVRYNLTAGENIGVGQVDALEDTARIHEAARRGMTDEVIDALPGGYAQQVGRRFAQGVDLSGGQWQKIAIARAWMRNAQVMILDEPTAALDARAEFEVFQRFRELAERRTAVLISHRFSSVRMADRILVLADGRIEASGTHETLMAQGGRYAELFELQAAGYR